ncbi:hypothetical protein [Mesobacillus jeotgali]|uniref:Transposase n=1 Tax=Mesobacillus jeotgali TaxID=129985 RepID=A0ABY9VLH3_9BACI|nr:hypothetical protein [Mesobacillus jeotgali]WNF24755.1 hypothetical protein RH061_09815 [Mesobacillus jeotgali]
MNKLKEFYRSFRFRLFRIKPNSAGWTSFAPLKIIPEYKVDMEKSQVTGIVKHDGEIYLTVIVDIHNNKTVTRGSLRRIRKYTHPFKKEHYIDMVKGEAESLREDQTFR